MNEGETMLSLTKYTSGVDATKKSQQFAFLNVNEEFYLYSYGAEKFVAKDGNGQKLTEELSAACLVTFDASTITDKKIYPLCVRVSGWHLCATPSGWYAGNCGIVTNWNDTGDAGNAVAIVPVDGTVDLSAAIVKIETYQIAREKATLNGLISEATTLAGKSYIGETSKTALNAAITAAQNVYDNAETTFVAVTEQITALNAAIKTAGYVTTVDGFANTAIYTFVSNRGWMGAAADAETVKSINGSADDPYSQWAVYTSNNGKYYLYNIGKEQFMGLVTTHDANIPFAATPQMTTLTFKKSNSEDYPIMFSVDNKGAVNNNNGGDMIYWDGGWTNLNDGGNNHKVAIVGELDDATQSKIADAVAASEPLLIAREELNEYLTYFKNSYYDEWNGNPDYQWRDQEGVNNYTVGYNEPLTLEEYYNNAKTVADDAEATVEELTNQLEILEGVDSWVEINQPEVGKFYRLRCVDGKKYLQSTIQAEGSNKDRLTLSGNNDAEAAFLYDGQGLLSYTAGLYMDHRVFNDVGTSSTVTFSEAKNGSRGCYNIKVGANYIYGTGETLDSGSGTPDDRSGYNWWLEEVTTLPVAVSAAGYATLYAPVALTIPAEGVTVYTATVDGTTLNLNALTGTIPANTGVIIEAAQGTYNFDVVADVEPISGNNALTGKYAKSVKNADAKVYTLQNGANGVGFYLFKGYKDATDQEGTKTYINGFRAWVELPADSNVQALRFTRGDEEDTTGIESVEASEELVIFDLAGRRVEKMEKGIYIVNGKKVVIK